MRKSICVYSSSSDAIEPAFFKAAEELGKLIAQEENTLIYGGGNIGLMGALARSVQAHGGRVVGVIPEFMLDFGVAYKTADELILTSDMRERKAIMEARAESFIGLPGGFGTLEELLEIITLKQLGRHHKPIVFLNVNGYYDPLVAMFDHICEHRFAKSNNKELYHVAPEPRDALDYITSYEAPAMPVKWF